jgi:hypothetical protein
VRLTPIAGASFPFPNLAFLERAVGEGTVVIDETHLEECLEHLAALQCNEYEAPEPDSAACEPPEPAPETPCAMAKLFVGQVGEGGKCNSPGPTSMLQDIPASAAAPSA